MGELQLDDRDREILAGGQGKAAAVAMQLLVRLARVCDAPRFIDVTQAHIDSCLFHGRAGLDFAERFASAGARVVVPTTLNVSSLDLLHPGLYRGDAQTAGLARRLMDAYVAMGCEPTWTCAPYQLPRRPGPGEHIAWAESNAIVFANSVLGARTDRYGDFVDICAAITGRVPYAGLHTPERRRGDVVFDLTAVSSRLLEQDVVYPALGHLAGKECGSGVPVFVGLAGHADEDRLKALGAAAASSGAVALFHAVGVTPEAATIEQALHARPASRTIEVDAHMLRSACDDLTTSESGRLVAVSLGTPHLSITEFERLAPLVADRRFADGIDVWISTSRHVLECARRRGFVEPCEKAGARLVTDTCTYITPILRDVDGIVMTNSAKWAYYAPGNLGVEVAFGSLEECIDSAVAGRICRDETLWQV